MPGQAVALYQPLASCALDGRNQGSPLPPRLDEALQVMIPLPSPCQYNATATPHRISHEHPTSPHLSSPYLISSHLASRLVSPHLTNRLVQARLTSLRSPLGLSRHTHLLCMVQRSFGHWYRAIQQPNMDDLKLELARAPSSEKWAGPSW